MSEKSFCFRYFMHEKEAEEGYKALLRRGYLPADISVVMAQTTYDRYQKSELLDSSSFLHGPGIFLRWPEEAHSRWNLAEKESRHLRQELCSGGALIVVSPRNSNDEIFLKNLWAKSVAHVG